MDWYQKGTFRGLNNHRSVDFPRNSYQKDLNRGLLGTPGGRYGVDFRRVAIHIGAEIERVMKSKGIKQKALAQQIPVGVKKVRETVFEKASLDSQMLARIGEILNHDFFVLYQKKSPVPYADAPASSSTAEPSVPVSKAPPIQLLINIDPNDTELEKKVRQLIRILK